MLKVAKKIDNFSPKNQIPNQFVHKVRIFFFFRCDLFQNKLNRSSKFSVLREKKVVVGFFFSCRQKVCKSFYVLWFDVSRILQALMIDSKFVSFNVGISINFLFPTGKNYNFSFDSEFSFFLKINLNFKWISCSISFSLSIFPSSFNFICWRFESGASQFCANKMFHLRNFRPFEQTFSATSKHVN